MLIPEIVIFGAAAFSFTNLYFPPSRFKAGFHWRRSPAWSRSRSLKRAHDPVKIENRSWKRHKFDGIGVGRTFPFLIRFRLRLRRL